jgi:hypothetical protein
VQVQEFLADKGAGKDDVKVYKSGTSKEQVGTKDA